MERNGFEINNRFYSFPERFRLGDPVLVSEATGMRWSEFVEALQDWDEESEPDQVVLFGLMAVGYWQAHPELSRRKVVQRLSAVYQDTIEIVSEGDEGDDAGPPESGADSGAEPPSTQNGSESSLVASSDGMNLSLSGTPGSAAGSPE